MHETEFPGPAATLTEWAAIIVGAIVGIIIGTALYWAYLAWVK